MRLLHLIVAAALVVAAAYVYKIKFESTLQGERVAKLRTEIRHEHDAIAALRAEWAQLDNPIRIQALAQRHLALKPIDPAQIDTIDHLPVRPADAAAANDDAELTTGGIRAGAIERTKPIEGKPGQVKR